MIAMVTLALCIVIPGLPRILAIDFPLAAALAADAFIVAAAVWVSLRLRPRPLILTLTGDALTLVDPKVGRRDLRLTAAGLGLGLGGWVTDGVQHGAILHVYDGATSITVGGSGYHPPSPFSMAPPPTARDTSAPRSSSGW